MHIMLIKGKCIITCPRVVVLNFGLVCTEEGVINMSRSHLKCIQDGTLGDYTRVVNNGILVTVKTMTTKKQFINSKGKHGTGKKLSFNIDSIDAKLHETIVTKNKLKDQQNENTKSERNR